MESKGAGEEVDEAVFGLETLVCDFELCTLCFGSDALGSLR